MKILIASVFVITILVGAQALTEEQKEKIKANHKTCLAESKVDPELITKAREGNFVDDEKLKEHFLCTSKLSGFQNDDGEIQIDVIKAKLGPELNDDEETDKIIAKCAIKKDTPQETAFETIKCYYESTPKHISLA